MAGEDAFLTIAEFAMALAGFTSVVVIFSRRGEGWKPVDAFRIRAALWGSLGAGFFALIPSGLRLVGVSGQPLWRVSSSLFAVFIAVTIVDSLHRLHKLDSESRLLLGPIAPRAMPLLIIIALLLQLANAVGAGFEPQPGAYFFGLLLLLLGGVIAFVRTLFIRPI